MIEVVNAHCSLFQVVEWMIRSSASVVTTNVVITCKTAEKPSSRIDISHEFRNIIIAQLLIKNRFQPDWVSDWDLGSKNFGRTLKHGCSVKDPHDRF